MSLFLDANILFRRSSSPSAEVAESSLPHQPHALHDADLLQDHPQGISILFSKCFPASLTDFPTHKIQLNDLLSSRLANGPQELDILEWMTRVALELIGQGGLGYSFETLEEGKTNRYTTAVKMLLYVFPLLRSTSIISLPIRTFQKPDSRKDQDASSHPSVPLQYRHSSVPSLDHTSYPFEEHPSFGRGSRYDGRVFEEDIR